MACRSYGGRRLSPVRNDRRGEERPRVAFIGWSHDEHATLPCRDRTVRPRPGRPTQSGEAGQSGEAAQSTSTDRGNQAPDVDVSDNEARCDLTNLQPVVSSNQQIGTTTYVELTFTNEGTPCWISGFPQVSFASGGATVSEAVRDGEDPGNVYTIPQGGQVGVTLTAESVDGVDGCTAENTDRVDIADANGGGSTSLLLSLGVCQNIASVAVGPYEPRS